MFKVGNLKKYVPDIINCVLVALFGVITYLYFEGQNWTGYRGGRLLTDVNFFVESSLLFVFDVGFIIYSVKYYKIQIRTPFLLALLVTCFFALIPIWGFSGATFEGRVVYTIGAVLSIRYSILTIMVFISIFVFIFLIPQLIKNREAYKLFIYIVIGVGLVATIYSYIFESSIYSVLFTNPDAYSNVPQSYTTNRNVYAYICIMAMLCVAYLLAEKGRPWRWVLFFYFFANACFTFSKTCILLGLLIVFVFSIYEVIKMWPTRRKAAIALASGISVALVVLVIISLVEFGGFLGKLHAFTNFLFYELPKINSGSLESRKYFFNVANDVLSHSVFTRIFGFGYGNWNVTYFASYTGNPANDQPMDVAYAVDMFEFGFPGLAFSIALWGLAIYLVIMQFINKSKYAFINALMLLCFLLRTVTEAGDFTHPNLTGTTYYLVLLCPMMAESKNIKLSKNEECRCFDKKNVYTLPRIIYSLINSALLVVSVFFLCLSFRSSGGASTAFMAISIIAMVLSVVFAIVSFVLLSRVKTMSREFNDRAFLQSALGAAFCVVGWAVSYAILTGNKGNLDGMTYLLICLLSMALMAAVYGIIVMDTITYKEKEVLLKPKKKKK